MSSRHELYPFLSYTSLGIVSLFIQLLLSLWQDGDQIIPGLEFHDSKSKRLENTFFPLLLEQDSWYHLIGSEWFSWVTCLYPNLILWSSRVIGQAYITYVFLEPEVDSTFPTGHKQNTWLTISDDLHKVMSGWHYHIKRQWRMGKRMNKYILYPENSTTSIRVLINYKVLLCFCTHY